MTEKDITLCGHGSGYPSTKNMYEYNVSRYAKIASNGKRKGVIAVRRPKMLTDALRPKFHDTYKTILGRNYYNQLRRGYVYKKYLDGKYYSDCSSSGCATLGQIGLPMTMYNTAGIYNSETFADVKVIIKDGHIVNPEVLKVGDAILYVGDDPSRPLQIGHVEWVYEIKNIANASPTKKAYSGTFPIIPSKGYLGKGDKSTDVKRLQLFLNWYGNYKLATDSDFGKNTENAVKDFQQREKLVCDGQFGAKSLAKAKTIKK